MELLPTLKILRESLQLSQRGLAEKSGVAHDTIGQLERGERKARPSTVRKLADSLNVSPFLLTCRYEELGYLTEEQLSNIGRPEAVALIRNYLVHGAQEQLLNKDETYALLLSDLRHKERLHVSFDPTRALADIDQAYTKLNPYEDKPPPYKGELVQRAEAALILARTAAQLLREVVDELPSDPKRFTKFDDTKFDDDVERNDIEKLAAPFVEAWLEGSAATKRLLDLRKNAISPLGSSSLEIESEESAEEGGAHRDARD